MKQDYGTECFTVWPERFALNGGVISDVLFFRTKGEERKNNISINCDSGPNAGVDHPPKSSVTHPPTLFGGWQSPHVGHLWSAGDFF